MAFELPEGHEEIRFSAIPTFSPLMVEGEKKGVEPIGYTLRFDSSRGDQRTAVQLPVGVFG